MQELTVGLFNDSFPPTIDGVANATLNYAKNLPKCGVKPVVATPWYPKVVDDYDFPVIRYPSAYISKSLGYRAGYPFDPVVLHHLEKQKLDVIHTHCPFISATLARVLRFQTKAPIVFTYHTKFDIDIERRAAISPLRSVSLKFLLSNINACDEVWVVSNGAGENLRNLGYQGEYVVMENGTDFPKGRAEPSLVESLRSRHGIPFGTPVLLFVGRIMWYKGLELLLDGLAQVKASGQPFHMIFVGDGLDRPDVEAYAKTLGLQSQCTFTGKVMDREILRGYFTLASLFLFPSTYDTNGLVVREAAACGCPSVLIAGSCASEGVVHGETGLLCAEASSDFGDVVCAALEDLPALGQMGQAAEDKLYLSWEDAVQRAAQRYHTVLEQSQRKAAELPEMESFFANVQRISSDFTYQAKRIATDTKRSSRWLVLTTKRKSRKIKRKLRDYWKKDTVKAAE